MRMTTSSIRRRRALVEEPSRCSAMVDVSALTLVPKHARLDGHSVYVGIPARRVA